MAFGASAFSAYAQEIQRPEPEIATGTNQMVAAEGDHFMISTANEHASRAGYEILKRGGSAVDAAITAQLVLGLVEPQSSGLGGGAFVLYYDAETQKLHSYDARETAPSLAGPFLFHRQGQPMTFKEAQIGGRSVGVPGVPKLLYQLHERHGAVTWMELFENAKALAENGFEVSPRLHQMIKESADDLALYPETARYFLDENAKPKPAGALLKNPEYLETLKSYAFYGDQVFYRGDVGANIVRTVQGFEENPGLLSFNDLRSYEVKIRGNVCGPYRSYIVCSMGEPSSGALTMLQILAFLQNFDLPLWGSDDFRSWHVIAEASRLAFADRGQYMADPDFVNTPGIHLLDPDYIKERGKQISLDQVKGDIGHGRPPSWDGPLYAQDTQPDFPGTSHISVVDEEGNIVSMTTTIESAFGSHLMVGGFLLNNELTDFAFVPRDEAGRFRANMVEAGKRPRSSMSPAIVFDQSGRPVLVIGSAGGSRIIGFVLQRLIAVLDWGMDVQDALDMPSILSRGNGIESETDMQEHISSPVSQLQELGHSVTVGNMTSGLTAIHIKNGKFYGAADKRREGLALGK